MLSSGTIGKRKYKFQVVGLRGGLYRNDIDMPQHRYSMNRYDTSHLQTGPIIKVNEVETVELLDQ